MRSSSSAPVGLLAVVVLAAALAGVIAFVLLRQPVPDVGGVSGGDGGARAVTGAATIGETQAATPRADVVAQQPQRSADVAPTSSLAPDRTPLEVRVVDTAGASVAGAVVTWAAEVPFPQQERTPPFWSTTLEEQLDHARRHGGAATTGADGVAVLSVGRVARFRVAAAHGDAFGVTMGSLDLVDAGVGCVVVVRPSHTLELEVRDHRNAPAEGLAVELRSANSSSGASLAVGTTDARGRLTVRHTQELVAYAREVYRFDTVVLATDVLGLDRATFDVDLAAPPRDVQVWKLPPTCAVEFVRADRRAGPVRLQMLVARQGANRQGEPPMRSMRPREVTLPYRIARVAGGVTLHALGAELVESNVLVSDLEGEGDTPAGGTDGVVTVTLRPATQPRITGRLVGRDGAPFPAKSVQLDGTFTGGHDPVRGTGAIGGSRFVVSTAPQYAGRTTSNSRLILGNAEQMVAEAALPTFAFPRVGALELGDVLALPVPLLVAGRVESGGKGVQNGRVAVEQFAADTGAWKLVSTFRVESDGSFRAHGAHVAGRLRLIATDAACLPSLPIEFAAGTEGLVVELRRGAALRAVYVAPAASAARAGERVVRSSRLPNVRLMRPANGDVAEHVAAEFQVQRSLVDGATVFVAHGSGLLPGTYRLEFSLPFVAGPVHAEMVVVPEPTSESETVLVRADLRETLRCVVLRFACGDGAVPPNEHVVVTAADGSTRSGVVVHGSAFELVVPNAGVDVDVIGPFERERVRVAVREDATVTFAAVRFAKVVLALELGKPVPPNVRVVAFVGELGGTRSWRAPFSADGVATVEVPAGASYETRIRVQGPTGPTSLTPESGRFTVDAGTAESRVRIELDPTVTSAWK